MQIRRWTVRLSGHLERVVPLVMRHHLSRLRHRVFKLGSHVEWGNLRTAVPFSTWGEGLPVDRYYIDSFVQSHSEYVRGHVLEVGASGYAKRFGGTRVSRIDVLDIDPRNDVATITGDLSTPGVLPESTFDCFLLLQTLQYVPDITAALQQAWESLAPGGR